MIERKVFVVGMKQTISPQFPGNIVHKVICNFCTKANVMSSITKFIKNFKPLYFLTF